MLLELPDFSRARVLVAGDVMLDRYWHGATSRISPEAPVPVVKVDGDEVRVGGAGNVALNISALGAGAALAALVGEDEAASTLREKLKAYNVVCRLLAAPGSRTITKLRVISRHQQLIRLDFEDGFPAASAAAMPQVVQDALDGAGALVLSDYAKGALAQAEPMIAAARAAGVPVVVDPKGTDFARYRGASVLTPNLAEFEAVVGACADDDVLVQRGEALRDALAPVLAEYDFVLMDCPPALNMLTVNGLVAAEAVMIPMQCEYYALEGLTDLVATLKRVRANLNPQLEIEGLLRTLFDPRSTLTQQVSGELVEHFGKKVYRTIIPRNVRLAEAPSYGKPVIAFDKQSKGAQAYMMLAQEIIDRRDGIAHQAEAQGVQA